MPARRVVRLHQVHNSKQGLHCMLYVLCTYACILNAVCKMPGLAFSCVFCPWVHCDVCQIWQAEPLPEHACSHLMRRGCLLAEYCFDRRLIWMLTWLLQVVQLCRQLSNRELERSHLLLLYGALSNCINSKEHRVRELVKDTLQLAGNELGLIAHDRSTDASE